MSEAFGRYQLGACVGAGGMAEVFRARLRTEAGVEKVVCVKRILPTHSHDPVFVDQFIDEARIAMQLQHPNVVAVYDFGRVGDRTFMAMEWVDGMNLHEALHGARKRGEALPQHLALFIAYEASKGLHHAHTACDPEGRPLGVVHRDVCPQNLLISFAGEVKVTDFGIARSAASASRTGDGVKGHVAYLSPEQALGGPLDARSDQFALGTVLYELLSGQRLFKAEERLLTLERVREARVPPLEDASPALDALLRRALARLPEERFPDLRAMGQELAALLPASPDALREELAAWLQRAAASTAPPAPDSTRSLELQTTRPGGAPRSRAAAILLFLAVLLGALLVIRRPEAPVPAPPAPAPAVVQPVSAPPPTPVDVAPTPPPTRPVAPRAPPVEAAPLVVEPAPPPTPVAAETPAPAPEASPAEAPGPGALTVRMSAGWGQVRIDGKRVKGGTPLVGHPLEPGSHLVQVEEPSTGRVWSREVVLAAGESTEISFP